MKKTLALFALTIVSGCGEWRLYPHENDPQEDRYRHDYEDRYPAPAPSTSAPSQPSHPMLPPTSSNEDSGADDLRCEGFATFCSDLDVSSCAQQKGCAISGDECIGAASPCSFQTTEATCERQLGCSWPPK